MKFYFTVASVIFINSFSICQVHAYLGANTGYGVMNMKDVNDNLQYLYDLIREQGFHISEPENLNGGFYFDGSFTLRSDMLIFGTSVNTISGSGSISYSDPDLYYQEKYDASTIEIMGMIGIKVPMTQVTSLVFKGYGGVGLANFEYLGEARYRNAADNIIVTQNANGSYFAGRIQGGVDFNVSVLDISIGLAYRIANSGKLKGDLIANGDTWSDMEFYDINENGMEIDYSGFTFLAGIQFQLD